MPRPCLSGDGAHCLGDGRFEVSVDWRANGENGVGRRIDLTDDSGLFYFFNPTNLELITKVLDACGTPFDSFWVFTAGLTNVQYVMEVFDSQTGLRRHYVNPRQTAALPVLDTSAFKTCAAGTGGFASAGESGALPGWARAALASRRDGKQAGRAAAGRRSRDATRPPSRRRLRARSDHALSRRRPLRGRSGVGHRGRQLG